MVAPPSPDLTGVCGPGVDQIVDRHTCIDLRLGGRVSRRTGAPVRRRRGAGTADTGARRIRLPTRPAKDTRVSTPTSRYRAFTRPGWLPPRRRCRRHKELVGTGHPQHPSRYRAAHIPALVPPLALRQSGRVGMWRSRGDGPPPMRAKRRPVQPRSCGRHRRNGRGACSPRLWPEPCTERRGDRSQEHPRTSLLRISFHLRGPLHPRQS